MRIQMRPYVENQCFICGISATEPQLGQYFEIKGREIYFCQEHAECFAMGLLLGSGELNSKIVDCFSKLEDDATGWELKRKIYEFVPYGRLQVLERARMTTLKERTPRDIYESLNHVVIGQDSAKRQISLAVYQHMQSIKELVQGSAVPDKHNVLLIGPSGTGKTLISHTVAKSLELPFISSDATSFSPTGFHGADADSMIADLLERSHKIVHTAERGVIFLDEVDKLASSQAPSSREGLSNGTQSSLLRLIEGKVVKIPSAAQAAMLGIEQQEVDTQRILWMFGGAFPGLAKIVGKNMGYSGRRIGFTEVPGSELEAAIGNYEILHSADLGCLQESLIEYGLGAEFVGRIPTIAPLAPLTKDELYQCLCVIDHSPVQRQTRLFNDSGIELVFEEEALNAIVDASYRTATGTRALNSLVKKAVSYAGFELLGQVAKKRQGKVIITKACLSNPSCYIMEKKKARKRASLPIIESEASA